MNDRLRNDAREIYESAIASCLPEEAVKNALTHFSMPSGRIILIAVGKAAWSMARAASEILPADKGLIITKHGYARGPVADFQIIEAGHPISDEKSIQAAETAIGMVRDLNQNDTVVFLLSGGGSALFEKPRISFDHLKVINDELLRSGATIREINTLRKRLSYVKGGQFARLCSPAHVFNIILSDIIGDPLDMIASGPTCPDSSTYKEALEVIRKYHLSVEPAQLNKERIDTLDNIETYIAGNNALLTGAAARKARELGYRIIQPDEPLTCLSDEAEEILSSYYSKYKNSGTAIILGGEITVRVNGTGKGGRNQHLALMMLDKLDEDSCLFCVGSDGTDGPTDAAGAYVDGTMKLPDADDFLLNNDSYRGLEKINGLIKTGPTGTNVCDLYCLLTGSPHRK